MEIVQTVIFDRLTIQKNNPERVCEVIKTDKSGDVSVLRLSFTESVTLKDVLTEWFN